VHRKDEAPTFRSSVVQSLVWIGLGIGLGLLFWPLYGPVAAGQYFSGYLIEKSLSVDNVFAWSVILGYFVVPKKYQYRVLYWGVFGALVMRAIFIFAGIALIKHFEPILLVFGLILLYSGAKLLFTPESKEFDPSRSWALKQFKKFIPISKELHGHDFFTRENGKRVATMLFVALLAVELTDIIFAVDSVPAVLAISQDPFIVFASNAAAILGLRSLFFVFETIKDKFWMLTHALGILLVLIGIKMLVSPTEIFGFRWFALEMPTLANLLVIVLLIGGSMVLSLVIPDPHHSEA